MPVDGGAGGGEGGVDPSDSPSPVSAINFWSDQNALFGIEFIFANFETGGPQYMVGSQKGTMTNMSFEPGEPVTALSMNLKNVDGANVIGQIKIVTPRQTKTVGASGGTTYDVDMLSGFIVGFHARWDERPTCLFFSVMMPVKSVSIAVDMASGDWPTYDGTAKNID